MPPACASSRIAVLTDGPAWSSLNRSKAQRTSDRNPHTLDSKDVNRVIRSELRPLLEGSGFDRGTARTSWRHHPDRIDVVNLQSFNSYNAGVLGVTTYSFAVNLGCYLRYVPSQYPDAPGMERLQGDRPQPREHDCHLRGRLARSYPERACKHAEIWYIDDRGANLDKALHDVRMVLNRDGLPWFSQFATPRAVYDILAQEEEQMDRLWGFGRSGSPIRRYLLGYSALAAGLQTEARENLLLAADTPSFESIRERILFDARRAGASVLDLG